MTEYEVMDKAMRLLASRAHSRRELSVKLSKKQCSKTIIAHVLDECERLHLIDDEQFAKDYAAEFAARGNGSYKIKQALFNKGIPEPLIATALETINVDETERGQRALEFKLKSLSREKDIRKKREKAYRFMLSRGFPNDIIRNLFDQSPELKVEG